MVVASSLVGYIFEGLIFLTCVVYLFYKWKFQYYKRKNIPFLEPSIPLGNLTLKGNRFFNMKEYYLTMKKNGWKYGGLFLFTKPTLIVLDLDIIKTILIKDFASFTDRGLFYNEKDDPLSAHLFALGGQKWRNLRTKLSPIFTSGRMKYMFQTLLFCKEPLIERVRTYSDKSQPIAIKKVLSCYTVDVIGSCAFGFECNSFKDEDSPFIFFGTKFFQRSLRRQLKLGLCRIFPRVAIRLGVKVIPEDVSEFFMKLVKDAVEHRTKTKVVRNDFLQLVIDLKNNKLEEIDGYKNDKSTSLSIEEIAAQMFVFFVAGYETSSTLMNFALYELSKDAVIQDKVRREVVRILSKHNNEMSYEAIHEMKYLQQVIDETLRKYPPIPFLNRDVTSNVYNLEEDVILENNSSILIPTIGIHHDEEYYPNPDHFDPDRFSEENKASRPNFTFLPFGEGPRMCIGMRFGLMQAKVGLASLLNNFKFSLNEETQEPLKMKERAIVLTPEGEIWLNVQNL